MLLEAVARAVAVGQGQAARAVAEEAARVVAAAAWWEAMGQAGLM